MEEITAGDGARPRLRARLLLRVELGADAVLLDLARVLALALRLGLGFARLGLLGERLLARLLALHLVDRLHEHALVLELVALRRLVQLLVQVVVDLLRLAVLAQEPPEDALAPHPQHLERHARVGGTLPLAEARVAALALRVEVAR